MAGLRAFRGCRARGPFIYADVMATPHISADDGAFAPAVIMPGDPKRAERIAAAVLAEARVVSDVRGIRAYTGLVDGMPLSVMASGMGMASITLYATELFRFYGVERVVRVGTAGGLSPRLTGGDVVVATAAHTTSSMNELRVPGVHFAAAADYGLVRAAMDAADGDPHVVAGTVVTNDHFYREFLGGLNEALAAHSVLACEMEAAGLYGVAAAEGKQALAVLTISNHITVPGRAMTSAERETTFDRALRVALAAALG